MKTIFGIILVVIGTLLLKEANMHMSFDLISGEMTLLLGIIIIIFNSKD